MTGSVFLTEEKNVLVIDVGGTSTDFGIIQNGLPKGAGKIVYLAGVRLNFQMPEMHSIGLGGGSVVVFNEKSIEIGPISVGSQLVEKGLAFGGNSFTATDISVAMGRFEPENFNRDKFKRKLSELTQKNKKLLAVALHLLMRGF